MKSSILMTARGLNLRGYTREQVLDELSLNYIDYGWDSTMILASTKWGISRNGFRIPLNEIGVSFDSNRFEWLRNIVNEAFDLWEESV